MGLLVGTDNVNDMYLGLSPVKEVYLGTTKIWPSQPPTPRTGIVRFQVVDLPDAYSNYLFQYYPRGVEWQGTSIYASNCTYLGDNWFEWQATTPGVPIFEFYEENGVRTKAAAMYEIDLSEFRNWPTELFRADRMFYGQPRLYRIAPFIMGEMVQTMKEFMAFANFASTVSLKEENFLKDWYLPNLKDTADCLKYAFRGGTPPWITGGECGVDYLDLSSWVLDYNTVFPAILYNNTSGDYFIYQNRRIKTLKLPAIHYGDRNGTIGLYSSAGSGGITIETEFTIEDFDCNVYLMDETLRIPYGDIKKILQTAANKSIGSTRIISFSHYLSQYVTSYPELKNLAARATSKGWTIVTN